MAMLNGIERYGDVYQNFDRKFVELAFDTKYRGIWQCRWTKDGMKQYTSEPPFESLTAVEQELIPVEAEIAFKFTHGNV